MEKKRKKIQDKPKNMKGTLVRFLQLLMTQKRDMLLILFAGIIGIGITALVPLIMGAAIDQLLALLSGTGLAEIRA
ncbi:MAG: hypothetical protein ACK5MN_00745 [Lachnospiraceae bacterium]